MSIDSEETQIIDLNSISRSRNKIEDEIFQDSDLILELANDLHAVLLKAINAGLGSDAVKLAIATTESLVAVDLKKQ